MCDWTVVVPGFARSHHLSIFCHLTEPEPLLSFYRMSTVVEIKEAIERLSPTERNELEALLWPDWDRPQGDTPPNVREKLQQAAA